MPTFDGTYLAGGLPVSDLQVKSFNEADARINIWCGAVRSGKTFSSILKLISLIKEMGTEESDIDDGDIMIIGVSRTTIQRNVITEMYKLLGLPSPPTKRMEDRIYGKNLYFVGAHDERAARSIQGSTLALAYVDEATCLPQPFWNMLLSRLSVKGARLLATCNPDAPNHWLKKDFIDRAQDLNLKHWKFGLDDNPILTEEYKESLKKEYSSGHWYKRYILGEWCIAHGLVYDGFNSDNIFNEESLEPPSYHIVGLDYGTSNATAAVLGAINPHTWPHIRIVDEYYYDSKKEGRSKTDAELSDDIYKWLKDSPIKNLKALYVDPSAASIKQEFRKKDLPVVDAKNDVLTGIRVCAKFIYQKNIRVHAQCKNLIEGIHSYAWDEKASIRGEDKPIKENDHAVDALRYMVASKFGGGTIHHPADQMTIEEIRKIVYQDENEPNPLF